MITGTRQRLATVVVAVMVATSVLAGLPVVGADAPDANNAIDRQNPAGVAIADRLQSSEGEVTVIARLETQSFEAPPDATTAEQRLKSHARSSQSDLVSFAERAAGVGVVQRFWLGNAVLLEVDTARTSLLEVASVQGVERLHPNYEFEIPEVRSDSWGVEASDRSAEQLATNEEYTYGLEELNVPDVWEEFDSRGGGAKVAVLDTGVAADHPAIDLYTEDADDPTYPGGWAEFDEDGNNVSGSTPHDTGEHGTHTSGTVAGQSVSDVPAFGVAPNVTLMHGLVLPEGEGTWAQVVAGMEWAVEEDADVISMSLGMLLDPNSDVDLPVTSKLIEPVRNARKAGTYVVVAAGNNGNDTITTPGGIYDATAIGASDSERNIGTFSSGGVVDPSDIWKDPPSNWPSEYVYPDVSAPGVEVLSSIPDDEYGYASGTSMAAPHVAGTVALMISASDDHLSPGEIDDGLARTADKPDGTPSSNDTRYGEGIVDAYEAVSAVADSSASSVRVTVSPSQGEAQVDESPAFDVVVHDVDAGVGSYAFSFSLSDPSVASIADVSLRGDPGRSTVNVSSDNSSVTVDTALADTADTGNVTIATVTVRATEPGSSDLDLSMDTVGDEEGDSYHVRGVSDGDLTVLEPATFAVSGLDPVEYVAEHDEVVTISATVGNAGDLAGEKTVGLRVDGESLTTRTETLDAGESTQVEFAVNASEFEAGTYTLSVWTADDNATGSLTVEAKPSPAFFVVAAVDPSGPEVVRGDRFDLSATIANKGDLDGEHEVDLRLGDEIVDSAVVALEGDAWTNVTFEVDAEITIDIEPGMHAYEIETPNASTGGTLTVLEPANLSVVSVAVEPTRVARNETVTVEATVGNAGDVRGSTNVTLFVDGDERRSKTVEVEGGANRTITFEVGFEGVGPHSVTVGDLDPTTVIVEGVAPVVLNHPATDPDGDGLYEDVNGDGEFDIVDVQALYANLESAAVQGNPGLFDFNGDGSVDLVDVQALYARL